MAKGLRSKSMRKNRSLLRKTIVEPMILERQTRMAAALQKNFEEKYDKRSILALKKFFPERPKIASAMDAEDGENDQNEEDEDEEEKAKKKPFSFSSSGNQIQRIVRGGRTIEVLPPKITKKTK